MNAYSHDYRSSGMVAHEIEEFCLRRQQTFYPKTDLDVSDGEVNSFLLRKEQETEDNRQTIIDICSSFLGRDPLAVIPLHGKGTFHSLYRAVFPDNERYIVRVNFHSNRAFEFLIDSWVTEVLKRKGVPTVAVYRVDLSRETYPFDYEILSEAPGKPLSAFEDEKTQYINLRLLSELGQLVAKMHDIETDGFGLLDVRSVLDRQDARGKGLLQTWKEYMFLNLDEHVTICANIGAINQQEEKRIAKVFSHVSWILEDTPSRLLHGDLSKHNIFSDGEHITGVIDWEDCLCGDPVFDIAFWGTFYRDYMLDPFLQGYRVVRLLPKDFEMRYWLYYLRIALSKTVHRYRFRYPDRPGRPPASLRIQKGLERLKSLGWG